MIHIIRKGQKQGPFALADVQRMLSAGALGPDDLAWMEGLPDWEKLSDFFPPTVRAPSEPPLPPKAAETNVEWALQIITIKPLVEKFRTGTFKDEEAWPYFLAYTVLEAVMLVFAYGEATRWDQAGSIATIIITIFGILHLKKQNRDSFGNGFLNKYFALGWVITVRIFLISIPIAVVLFGLAAILGGEEAFGPAGAIFVVTFGVSFYWWLGVVIAKSQHKGSARP